MTNKSVDKVTGENFNYTYIGLAKRHIVDGHFVLDSRISALQLVLHEVTGVGAARLVMNVDLELQLAN